MRKLAPLFTTALVVLVAGMPGPLRAEDVVIAGIKAEVVGPTEVAEPHRQPDWGTVATAVKTIHGLGFNESVSDTTFSYNASNTHRFRTGGGFPYFDAELADLPAGALLVGLELEACDTSATQRVTATLFRHGSPNGANFSLANISTGDVATPGCAFFGGMTNVLGTQVVDNRNNSYFVRAEISGTDSTTSLGAVRVYYRLQVSPAPAVASFTDVPTSSPQFRFVEALVAAGITGGCGGGNFCPNDAVTRGQMAVFLSVALGLHFPN